MFPVFEKIYVQKNKLQICFVVILLLCSLSKALLQFIGTMVIQGRIQNNLILFTMTLVFAIDWQHKC